MIDVCNYGNISEFRISHLEFSLKGILHTLGLIYRDKFTRLSTSTRLRIETIRCTGTQVGSYYSNLIIEIKIIQIEETENA